MKERTLLFVSGVLFAAALAMLWLVLGKLGVYREANTNFPADMVNSESEKTQNQNVPPPTAQCADNLEGKDCVSPTKPNPVSDVKIAAVKLKKGQHSAPQIAEATTMQRQKFNAFVRKLVTSDYSSYDVSYTAPEFVSLYLYEEFCGASCHVKTIPVNFDLEAGRPLEHLSELFKPGSNYLTVTASYCIRELKRKWTCGEAFEDGSSPKESNYSVWRVSRKGVEITFEQYQLGPGACGGTSVMVPYSQLRGILREDVGWFRSLGFR